VTGFILYKSFQNPIRSVPEAIPKDSRQLFKY
jgi:hypothetical protein